jgi:hypothetical protein
LGSTTDVVMVTITTPWQQAADIVRPGGEGMLFAP